jgi:hypothetical protein
MAKLKTDKTGIEIAIIEFLKSNYGKNNGMVSRPKIEGLIVDKGVRL